MVRFNDLRAIAVKHETAEGDILKSMITLREFERAFVKQRWKGERRYNKEHTIWGLYHTSMTVRNGDMISRRWFDFPQSIEEAEKRHREATAV